MLMDENLCSFTLKEANAARKIVAKKQLSQIPELHEKVLAKAKSENLGKYIWECGIGPQMSYSFSIIHALAYSFIAYQAAYLATKWDPIYWDTACLIVNSSSLEADEEEEDDTKKQKSADYDKIAKAIANIMKKGIKVSLVDINKSDYTFVPDVDNQQILYGLKPISRLNDEMIDKIISLRPYKSITDFMNKCPLQKIVMINLIKAGAFDSLDTEFNNRKEIMCYYLMKVGDLKKRITLQNMPGLINYGIIPESLKLQKDVFNFNKYIKKCNYVLNDSCIDFINQCLGDDADLLLADATKIDADAWKKVYDKHMDIVRDWIAGNKEQILNDLNFAIFKEVWNKYASGTLARWEMDSVCFYSHPHELAKVDFRKYGIVDFNKLKSNEIESYFTRNKMQIPIYKLYRIAGTVIGKDDTKRLISLLTTTGVVTVKFTRDYYGMFKKQISTINPETGKKTVVEKSWFGRGNMLMVQGYRREDTFVAKNYSKSESHQLYKITDVINDSIMLVHERASGLAEDEEYENE
jgi:DNA polymerase-3 subunit alpha